MKTEDIIWPPGVELPQLPQGECLPLIGGCQVSSILSTLDSNPTETVAASDPRPSRVAIIDLTASEPAAKKDDKYENMLYFVCNLCSYLCIEDVKITEHLEAEHKSSERVKEPQLKCPACPNVFSQKKSLRPHLMFDHRVSAADLPKILQAVSYFARKSNSNVGSSVKTVETAQFGQARSAKLSNDNCGGPKPNGATNGKEDDHRSLAGDDSLSDTSVAEQRVELPIVDVQLAEGKAAANGRPVSKFLEQKYKCSFSTCKVRLQDHTKMCYHLKCHTAASFKCPDCNDGTDFSAWKTLAGHLWRTHRVDMELYACDRCEYKTASWGKLNTVHRPIHSEQKSFSCDVCSKGFKTAKQMRNHRRIHRNVETSVKYVCDVCAKGFANRRRLKLHTDVVHNKLKPYLCSTCGYKSSSKGGLNMHMRQHTGEKPFGCDQCSYATADHNSLRRHKMRHSGSKPYKCAYCDYSCIQTSTYKVHLKTKHPGLEKDHMFACDECQFRTINKEMYLSHVTKHSQTNIY